MSQVIQGRPAWVLMLIAMSAAEWHVVDCASPKALYRVAGKYDIFELDDRLDVIVDRTGQPG